MSTFVLAGDVGGTKVNIALFERGRGCTDPVREESFPTRGSASLEEIVGQFLRPEEKGQVAAACFGIAGPIDQGRSKIVNLPWQADQNTLSAYLGGAPAQLINDLVAMAWGVGVLPAASFEVIHEGKVSPQGHRGLIAAGTGLGEALIVRDGERWIPVASEGGHTEFGPNNKLELALAEYLLDRFGHASYERIVSGPGLYNVYQFLRDTGRGQEPEWVTRRLETEDPGKVIGEGALARTCPLCEQTMELFMKIYGAQAGNLALTAMTTGGMYLGGGIAPRNLPFLKSGHFMEGFTAKGRFANIMVDIPVLVITEHKTPLWGAASCAFHLI